MDLFDLDKIVDLIRIEPGHNLIQCLLLFMIWIQSKGVRKELTSLKEVFELTKARDEQRFLDIETRVARLNNHLN